VLLTTVWLLRGYMARRGTGAATTGLRRRLDVRALSATVAFIAFALLSNLDIVLAKLFLSPEDAGHYAALSTLGKAIMFLPGAVAVVLVPNAARARHTTGDAQRVLRIAALLVLVTTTLASLPAILAPELIIDLMFGAGYEGAVDGVLPIVGAGAGLALLNLLLVYTVAIADRRWTLLLAFGVLLQVAAISAFHGSPAAIATAQVVVVAAILVVNELGFHSLIRTPRTAILSSDGETAGRG
jgi:O-antigen/teichoic acid export membrane protein